MPYRIAGIDVHKKMLAVVVADVESDGEYHFERQRVGSRKYQIIAEVGASAATFPSPKHLASWMGACPGTEESASVNYTHR